MSNRACNPLVIVHAECMDGFAAAWVARRRWPSAEIVFAKYGDLPPKTEGREVWVFDFSYPRVVLLEMREHTTVRVFDHHRTAQAELDGLSWCTFDMERSGAALAWDALFPDEPRPALVEYIQDRDLWRFALPNSRALNAAIQSYAMDLDTWSVLAREIEVGWPRDNLRREGDAILRYQARLIDDAVERMRIVQLDDREVPTIRWPSKIGVSEAIHALLDATGAPVAAAIVEESDGSRVWSLRSPEGGPDVSEIARRHGGGGHRHAAGFTEHDPVEMGRAEFAAFQRETRRRMAELAP